MVRLAVTIGLCLTTLLCAVAGAADAPIFAGVWSKKEDGGTGGFFYDQTWDQLVANWKALGRQKQYLAKVEAYKIGSEWRFAAIWRVGSGNGALLLAPWSKFVEVWNDLKPTQELIDIEVLETNGEPKFLGVWREKQDSQKGSGGLFAGLTWDELVEKWKELGKQGQYLAALDAYGRGNAQKFAAVWRIGAGSGALYWLKDWHQFTQQKRNLDKTQEMIDFEIFQSDGGGWNFLGVWRSSDRAGPLHASTSSTAFKPLSAADLTGLWKQNQRTATLVALAVAVPHIPALTALRADTNCKFGDTDCNRCATDVPNQFKLGFEGGHRPWIGWHSGSWTFHGDDRYPPDNRRPEDAFYPHAPVEDGGPTSKHIQGFVRTNSPQIRYAGSHSHKETGSVFFIEHKGGDDVLHSLYRASNDHPSGVAVLGDYLFVAEHDRLRRFKISGAGTQQKGYLKIPADDSQKKGLQNGGGGIGLAKLEDETTLLIVSAPGGGFREGTLKKAREENARPRFTRFYRIVPNATAADAEAFILGEWPHQGESSKPSKPLAYSENMSVVTECGTGHIYTIHTTGDYGLRGDGYWRLERVETNGGTLGLVHLQTVRQDQHSESCHHRSAATVHVNSGGQLEYLCTERNVIKFNPTGKFSFKEGTP